MPGIYAWYADIKLGRLDWIETLEGDRDLGETRLKGALDAFSSYFGRQRLDVEAHAHFSTIWQGSLEEDPKSRGLKSQSKIVSTSLQSSARRELLVSASFRQLNG